MHHIVERVARAIDTDDWKVIDDEENSAMALELKTASERRGRAAIEAMREPMGARSCWDGVDIIDEALRND